MMSLKKIFDFESDPVGWLGITIISAFCVILFTHFFITMPAGYYPQLWRILSAVRIFLVFGTFLLFGYYIGVLLLPRPSLGILSAVVLAFACTYNPVLDLLRGVQTAEMDEVHYGFEEIFESSSEYTFATRLIPMARIVFSGQKSPLLEVERHYFESHWEYCAAQGATPYKIQYLRHLEVLLEVECGGSGTPADVKDFIRSRTNCVQNHDALSCYSAGKNFEQGIAVAKSTAKAEWFYAESSRLGFTINRP